MQRYIVPEAARNIRERSVFNSSIEASLSNLLATIAAKIVSTVFSDLKDENVRKWTWTSEWFLLKLLEKLLTDHHKFFCWFLASMLVPIWMCTNMASPYKSLKICVKSFFAYLTWVKLLWDESQGLGHNTSQALMYKSHVGVGLRGPLFNHRFRP